MARRSGASRGSRHNGARRAELPLGVVVVDQLAVVRAGIAMLIEDRADMEVLAEAGTVEECLESVARIRRGRLVVLAGLGLSGRHDALWLIRTLRERFPSVTIVASGANASAGTISRALFVGADGYVDKRIDPVEFLQAIRAASRGEVVLAGMPGEWIGPVAEGIDRHRGLEAKLTQRERQVLTVAAEGLTAREIARRLGVRERTVTTHLGRIYGKLGVRSRVGAIAEAARSGLVSVGSPPA